MKTLISFDTIGKAVRVTCSYFGEMSGTDRLEEKYYYPSFEEYKKMNPVNSDEVCMGNEEIHYNGTKYYHYHFKSFDSKKP